MRLEVILIAIVVAVVISDTNGSAVPKGKKKANVKNVLIKSAGNGRAKVKGKFADELEVEIDVNGKGPLKTRLKKQNIDTSQEPWGKNAAVYADDKVTLRQECEDSDNNEEICTEFALMHDGDGATFVNGKGKGLVLDTEPGEIIADADVQDDPDNEKAKDKDKTTVESGNNEQKDLDSEIRELKKAFQDLLAERKESMEKDADRKHGAEKREVLKDYLYGSKVVKTVFFVDDAFLYRFFVLNDYCYRSAKRDVKKYLTLVTNEMTMLYSSLLDYGYRMTINGESGHYMHISVTLADVEFPAGGTPYDNFWFSEHNVEDGMLLERKRKNAAGDYEDEYDALGDFAYFLQWEYEQFNSYDFAILATGYDYRKQKLNYYGDLTSDTNLLGLATLSSMCKTSRKESGRSSSVSQISASFSSTCAHEMGHSFGMMHDNTYADCDNDDYVMGGNALRKFSRCSAENLADFFNGLSADKFVDTCLMPIDNNALDKFCAGFVGTGFTPDEQCIMFYGPSAKRLESSNALEESHLEKDYVTHCMHTDDGYPFKCFDGERNRYVSRAATGTKCVDPFGNRSPGYICYKGECVSNKDIC